jgi:hypothetical protein
VSISRSGLSAGTYTVYFWNQGASKNDWTLGSTTFPQTSC